MKEDFKDYIDGVEQKVRLLILVTEYSPRYYLED